MVVLSDDLESCSVCGELVDVSSLYWVNIPGVVLCKDCWKEQRGDNDLNE